MGVEKRHITPIQRNVKLMNALRLAVVAFSEYDYGKHLQAMDQLMDLGRRELAQGFTCEWHNAMEMDEEKSRTSNSAYASAQGYGRG